MLFSTDQTGFTLIELVVVIAILAIMSVIALPKIAGFIGDERKDSTILKAYMEAITEDSFVHRKTNYLCLHLSKPGEKNSELFDDSYNDNNMINVYEFFEGKFILNKNNLLKARVFSYSFSLTDVILEGGRSISSGNILIPFYSDGTSADFTLIVNSGNSKIVFKKNKCSKVIQVENDI